MQTKASPGFADEETVASINTNPLSEFTCRICPSNRGGMAAGGFSFLGNKFLVHPKTDSVHGLVAASADGSASAPGGGGKDDLLAQPEHAKIPANKKNRSVFILEKDLGQGYQDL